MFGARFTSAFAPFVKNLKSTTITAKASNICKLTLIIWEGCGNPIIPPIEKYINGNKNTSESKNRLFKTFGCGFLSFNTFSSYSSIPYPSPSTACIICSRASMFSSYSTAILSPISDTSAVFIPFNFRTVRSIPAEQAEQVIPVTVNFSFIPFLPYFFASIISLFCAPVKQTEELTLVNL